MIFVDDRRIDFSRLSLKKFKKPHNSNKENY